MTRYCVAAFVESLFFMWLWKDSPALELRNGFAYIAITLQVTSVFFGIASLFPKLK
jgi:hypothetical protein